MVNQLMEHELVHSSIFPQFTAHVKKTNFKCPGTNIKEDKKKKKRQKVHLKS